MSYGGATGTRGSGGRLDQPRSQPASMYPLHRAQALGKNNLCKSKQEKKKLLSHTLLLSCPRPATCLLCRLSTRDIYWLSGPECT